MKKILSLLILVSMLSASLISCSNDIKESTDSSSEDERTSDTTATEDENNVGIRIAERNWTSFGDAEYSDGVLTLGKDAYAQCSDELPNAFIIECDITPNSSVQSGIRINDKEKYNYFVISPNTKEKGLAFTQFSTNGNINTISVFKYEFKDDEFYHIKAVIFNGSLKIYLADSKDNITEYPAIDLPFEKYRPNTIALDCTKGDMKVKNIEITENDIKLVGNSYTNPIAKGADPFVLCHDGVYYLYSTNAPTEGYKVSTSTDLNTWSDKGFCLVASDVYGTPTSSKGFWAPEVYYYKGQFYMIYTVEEHIGIAVSDSPLGPFKSPKQSFINNDKREIDGHLFFDDDGKVYIYFVRCASDVGPGKGNEIFGAEFDMVTFTYKNEKCLIYPERNTWEWVGDGGYVAEGPAVLKHEGRYYLTYSANGYTSQNYAIGLAISSTPLGSYSKYENNPILKKNSYIDVYGPGHHSFTYSPDGTELFIVYHKHNSSTTVHSRMVCIDRCNFVLDPKLGYDVLSVVGPTSTAQPLPSGVKK